MFLFGYRAGDVGRVAAATHGQNVAGDEAQGRQSAVRPQDPGPLLVLQVLRRKFHSLLMQYRGGSRTQPDKIREIWDAVEVFPASVPKPINTVEFY